MTEGPKHLRLTLSSHPPTLNGISLAPDRSVKDLDVIISQDLSFASHRKIDLKNKIFSSSHLSIHELDFFNAFLSGCINNSLKSIELIQNTAARTLTKNYEHISPVLPSLPLVLPDCPPRHFCSLGAGLAIKKKSRTGGRAFCYRAPLLWNNLLQTFVPSLSLD